MHLTKQSVFIDVILPRANTKTVAIARDIVLVLSFSILTAIGAKLKIETGTVPITMQTLAVLLSGALLGSRKGALSQLTYLSMGLIGIPWFARGGGMAYLLSPTFGYIIGFVLASFLVGWLCERGFDKKLFLAILAMILGNIIIYLPGLLWLGRFIGFEQVLKIGFYPFIVGDLLKILLASTFLPLGWQLIQKVKKNNLNFKS